MRMTAARPANLKSSNIARRVQSNIDELPVVQSGWWTRKRRRIAFCIMGSSVCVLFIAAAFLVPASLLVFMSVTKSTASANAGVTTLASTTTNAMLINTTMTTVSTTATSVTNVTTHFTTTTTSTATTTSATATTTSTTSTSSVTSTTLTTATSIALPAQCSSHTTITDATRLASAGAATTICDNTIFTTTPVWARFSGGAGTQLVTSAPNTFQCNTYAPGWYTGSLPAVGGTVSGIVCYNWGGNTCNWQNAISVTSCNGFYVYQLIAPPACALRYCTM